ncbi:thioredoxin domain-containing protein [Flexithrix dorotheae]|uniref:thioredoxin domain-containing protein n=1 Tax=Flexithrix dorotheae TaxID=70993 RepID=UPI00036008C3|nr:thioredoxin domain-containing protein [Flexithrix dorotheae]
MSTPNKLIKETSPYLLQHAYNPVEWFPWGREALNKAIAEDKPIIVSIGYSACHWCHVMEKESFENEEVATIMNKYFICIKVDREERPDIDQIYMEAIQNMGIQGGWPLNVILTPDANPFYGGTYFPAENWKKLMLGVVSAFRDQREAINKSADEFKNSLNISEVDRFGLKSNESSFSINILDEAYGKIEQKFDLEDGGLKGAPKFPMPSIYSFLLDYYAYSENENALKHVVFTLEKMANGGIYDQIGGGFSRYSVDNEWFAPHFEKMLYDNAQLISLYSKAYTISQSDYFRRVVEESITFIERELTSTEGGFYSALDADSEGVEGKFYTWEFNELVKLLGDDISLFEEYYNVKIQGNWEDGTSILYKTISDEKFAEKHQFSRGELNDKINYWKREVLEERSKRVRPGLDDKILASWNGLMLKGLVDAYAVFGNEKFLELALRNASFIEKNMMRENRLFHSFKEGRVLNSAFLEDYSSIINGFLALFQICGNKKWLNLSKNLLEYAIENFFDSEEHFFFFTDKNGEQLIARKKEIFDNVIPSSNSMMAENLLVFGEISGKKAYLEMAKKMTIQVAPMIEKELRYLTNWARVYGLLIKDIIEIVIIGKEAFSFAMEIQKEFIPNKIILATEGRLDLPLFKKREAIDGETTIYVCQNKTCQLPVKSVADALEQIKKF